MDKCKCILHQRFFPEDFYEKCCVTTVQFLTGSFFNLYLATIGGTVGVVVILCLTAVVFLLWRRYVIWTLLHIFSCAVVARATWGTFLINCFHTSTHRSRHRASNATNEIQIHHSNNPTCTYYIPVPVSDYEHCSAELNIADAADASTAVTKWTNKPQRNSSHSVGHIYYTPSTNAFLLNRAFQYSQLTDYRILNLCLPFYDLEINWCPIFPASTYCTYLIILHLMHLISSTLFSIIIK